MQILFHLGAHCTDQGLLIRSILRNRATLATEGILVPGPGRYRELIGDVSTSLRGQDASDDTEAMLLEAICDDATADRIILSNESFLCREAVAISSDRLYPKANKAAWLASCFPSHEVELAIALKNPATFFPELLSRRKLTTEDRDRTISETSLERLIWSDVILRLRDALPDARITVWCHEDTPFLWPEILSELTQHDPFTRLDGALDVIDRILTPEGAKRLSGFLADHPDLTENKRRMAIAAFLEAHADDASVATEIDLPGWTDATISDLTELYDDDVARISHIDGVKLLTP